MTQEAEQDVKDIWQYYEEQQKGLGKRMRKELQKNLKLLRQHPEMYAKFKEDVRKGNLKNFPYSFYYQNDMPKELVNILGIFAQAQDPKSLRKTLISRIKKLESL